MLQQLHRLLLGVATPLLVLALEGWMTTAPGRAAEEVTFTYGAFARSVPVSALRQYAETGEATRELAALLRFVKEADRESLRQNLNLKLPLNVVTVNNLLRSPAGEKLVNQIAEITIVEPQSVAPTALRAALLLSASSEQGLGVLSFLEAYPLRSLTVSIPALQSFTKEAGGLQGLMGNFLKPQ